jgi:heme oxygenase
LQREHLVLWVSATLDCIEQATRAYHAGADAPWLALMSSSLREQAYVRHLAITFGFEAPLEGAFAYTRGLDDVIPVRKRVRAGLIAQDLLALGVSPAELSHLPQCPAIAPFVEVSDALGWMYLIERATLLHDGVRRSVAQRLPRAAHATSYLCAAGSVAGVRWQSFGAALDAVTDEAPIADRIADAAKQAFRYWLEWVDWNDHGPLARNG